MAAARVRSFWEGMRDLAGAQIRILRPREDGKIQRADRAEKPWGCSLPDLRKGRYGCCRESTVALGARGIVGEKRVLAVMRKLGLQSKGAARSGKRRSGTCSSRIEL